MESLNAVNILLRHKAFRDKGLKTLQYAAKLATHNHAIPPLALLATHISSARRLYRSEFYWLWEPCLICRYGQFLTGLQNLFLLLTSSSLSPKLLAIRMARFLADWFDSLSYYRSLTGGYFLFSILPW